MVVLDFLPKSKVRLVMDVLVPLVSIDLVEIILLLLDVLCLEELLKVGALSFYPPQSLVLLLQHAQLLYLQQIVSPRSNHRHELLPSVEHSRFGLNSRQTYIYL